MGSRAWKVGGVGFGSTSDPNDELDFDHPEHLQLVFVILETYSCIRVLRVETAQTPTKLPRREL